MHKTMIRKMSRRFRILAGVSGKVVNLFAPPFLEARSKDSLSGHSCILAKLMLDPLSIGACLLQPLAVIQMYVLPS